MTSRGPREARIVGIGETEFSRASGRSEVALALEAAQAALQDAGLEPASIDGIVPPYGNVRAEDLVANLGIPGLGFSATVHLGGASSVGSIQVAVAAIEAGLCDYVLTYRARNGYSAGRTAQNLARSLEVVPGRRLRLDFEVPYGMSTPAQWYSMICRRHMHEYGTTREQLGQIALAMRAHANLNPHAMMYDRTLTLEEYLSARPIAEPYHLYDCCLETDGAVAVVLTTAERAKDLRRPPVRVAGIAVGQPDPPDDLSNRADFFRVGASKAAASRFRDGGSAAEGHGRRDDLRLLHLRGAASTRGNRLRRARRRRCVRRGRDPDPSRW